VVIEGNYVVCPMKLNISTLFPFRKPLSEAAIILALLNYVYPYLLIMLQFECNFYFPKAVFNGIPDILAGVVNKQLFMELID
jgi:hypothetical protein